MSFFFSLTPVRPDTRILKSPHFTASCGEGSVRSPVCATRLLSENSAFYGELRRRFSAIPGVRNATLSESSLIGAGTSYSIGGPGIQPNRANRVLTVGPAFFTTMQIPILAGRDIEERDRPGSPQVAV